LKWNKLAEVAAEGSELDSLLKYPAAGNWRDIVSNRFPVRVERFIRALD
jgi:hypothetical protein